jgi:hypothetical protein
MEPPGARRWEPTALGLRGLLLSLEAWRLIFSFNRQPERTDVDEEGWSGRLRHLGRQLRKSCRGFSPGSSFKAPMPQIPPLTKRKVKTSSPLTTMGGELQRPTASSSSAKDTNIIDGGDCSSSCHRISPSIGALWQAAGAPAGTESGRRTHVILVAERQQPA